MKLVVRIMHEVDLPRGHQLVLMGMAENANDDGTGSRPSVDKVAWKANYKPRRVIEIMRELERDGIIVKVREAAQHRAAEWDIRLGMAPAKMPFEEWRALHGRHAEANARDAKTASLEGEDRAPSGVQRSAPLGDSPGVQNRDAGVQQIASLEGVPGVQIRNPGVQSPASGVQNRASRGATQCTRTSPMNQSNEPSNEPVGGDRRGEPPASPRPATGDLVTLFYDYLEVVRSRRETPDDGRRPIPKTGPHCRGSFASDVARVLGGCEDPAPVERGVRRRALRWDGHAMDLETAVGDVIDGKPWTIEQEERARNALAGGGRVGPQRRRDSIAVIGATDDDYREEDYRFHA